MVISNVIEGSPADRDGLSVKDEIVAMDGIRADSESWEKRIGEARSEDRIVFTLFRQGILREVPVTLSRRPNVSCVIRPLKTASALQKRTHESWLKAPWRR
mgnify:CR=1 FL=1